MGTAVVEGAQYTTMKTGYYCLSSFQPVSLCLKSVTSIMCIRGARSSQGHAQKSLSTTVDAISSGAHVAH